MTEDTILLRSCRPEDLQPVLALWRIAETIPRPTDNLTALAVRIERDRQLFQLAWHGSTLVGSLLGGWDGWRGNMYRLAVHPAYRRRGLALRLVRAVELELRRLGAERITSLVFVNEPGAAAFWESAGYSPDLETHRYARDLR